MRPAQCPAKTIQPNSSRFNPIQVNSTIEKKSPNQSIAPEIPQISGRLSVSIRVHPWFKFLVSASRSVSFAFSRVPLRPSNPLFLRFLRIFAAIQSKFLSMNNLHPLCRNRHRLALFGTTPLALLSP